jgi:hypothetical protein
MSACDGGREWERRELSTKLGGLTLARKMRCGAAGEGGSGAQCQDWERENSGKREESH